LRELYARLYYMIFPPQQQADHIRVTLAETMTVSALLSGFSVGMALSVSDEEMQQYATWTQESFFGNTSLLCSQVMPLHLYEDHELMPQWTDAKRIASECNADGCWEGHWGTNNLAEVSGTKACSLSAAEMKQRYPAWFNERVLAKLASVHIEIGQNCMTIIWCTLFVTFLGSALLLSLSRRSTHPTQWVVYFNGMLNVLSLVPFFNFYNFLQLASRIVRIKFFYCDDYISDRCMVTATWSWGVLRELLGLGVLMILVVHLMLKPPTLKPEGGADSAPSESAARWSVRPAAYRRM